MTAQTQWTVDDWLENRCAKSEIGKPKPNEQEVQAELEALAASLNAETPTTLKQDILAAYRRLGGTKYLMDNPALLHKLLIKLANDSPAPAPIQVFIDAPWMSSDRLAYKRQGVIDIAPALAGNALLEHSAKPKD